MHCHLRASGDRLVYGTDSWPDRPLYMERALEVAEWLLAAKASRGSTEDNTK
jgi:hypothetical protein